MGFTKYATNAFIATGFSEFNEANIEDLADLHDSMDKWFSAHFLSSVLQGGFDHQARQVVIGLARRARGASSAYNSARRLTLEFLNERREDRLEIGRYYEATGRWEAFAIEVSMAIVLLRWLSKGNVFEKNDQSLYHRIYTLANHVKHLDSCVNSGQVDVEHTVPLWLSNYGLNSFDEIQVSFDECALLVKELVGASQILKSPSTAHAKAAALKEN
jgi:hypothetical protein